MPAGDGLKNPKAGGKMPGVKKLHQQSGCNNKAPFIMGHSCQAVAVLLPAAANREAIKIASVDLPTPPLPEQTAITIARCCLVVEPLAIVISNQLVEIASRVKRRDSTGGKT